MPRRVSLLHFTAEPCVGGVERVIEDERRILTESGYRVRLLVGAGGEGDGIVRLPELLPPPNANSWPIPAPHDAAVRELEARLDDLLAPGDACWVHNVLTVYLHPHLTVAVLRLMRRRTDVRWIAFCHDITAVSRFRPALSPPDRSHLQLPAIGVRYIVDSRARKSELCATFGLPLEIVRVLPPPLDYAWIEIGPESRQLIDAAAIDEEPIILVPAKLLPHKNLETAIRVAAELQELLGPATLLITGAASPHEPAVSREVSRALRRLATEMGLQERVTIAAQVLGRAPRRETVRELIMLADLVLVPSMEEGYGLPLQEAIALRTPVLCSDIAAFRESGAGCAEHFSLDESPRQIACRACAILSTRAAVRRRELLASAATYARAVRALAAE